jgi:hypothetical protein
VLTTLGVVPSGKAKINQSIEIRIGHGKNVTATTTVATVGAAELLVFFMPERDAASAAISSRDVNKGFVNELHDFILLVS